MNARTAIEVSSEQTTLLFNSASKVANRMNISVSDAIDKQVATYVKYSKNSLEATAWEARGVNAKKLI